MKLDTISNGFNTFSKPLTLSLILLVSLIVFSTSGVAQTNFTVDDDENQNENPDYNSVDAALSGSYTVETKAIQGAEGDATITNDLGTDQVEISYSDDTPAIVVVDTDADGVWDFQVDEMGSDIPDKWVFDEESGWSHVKEYKSDGGPDSSQTHNGVSFDRSGGKFHLTIEKSKLDSDFKVLVWGDSENEFTGKSDGDSSTIDTTSTSLTIEVEAGTYSKTANLDAATNDLTITGVASSRDQVKLQKGIDVNSHVSGLTVSNLTLKGGAGADRAVNVPGSGTSLTDTTFSNVLFDGEDAQKTAIYGSNVTGDFTLQDSKITGYTKDVNGESSWAIAYLVPKLEGFDEVTIESNNITSNIGKFEVHGNAGGWDKVEEVTIQNNEFSHTNQDGDGDAVAALAVQDAKSVTIDGNSFIDNFAQFYASGVNPDVDTVVGDVLDNNNNFDNAVVIDRPENSLQSTIWSSIQDAVDNAKDGDTVKVEPGTYNEKVTISSPGIKLVAEGSENPVISSDNREGVMIKESDITLKGFNVTTNLGDTGTHGQYGIRVEPDADVEDISIRENVVKDISDGYRARGISVDMRWSSDNTAQNITVEDNIAKNISTFDAGNGKTVASGIGFNERIHNITVVGNEVEDLGSENSQGALGIKLTEDGGPSTSVGPEGFEIVNNTVDGLNVDSQTYNDDYYDAHAIFVGGYPVLGNHEVSGNNFYDGLVYRYEAGDEDSLDATQNYWGAASGPSGQGEGSGVSVSKRVDYRPWLLQADGERFNQTLAVRDASGWALVSAPRLLAENPTVIDDNGDTEGGLMPHQGGSFLNPGESGFNDSVRTPVGAFFVNTDTTAGIGFEYESTPKPGQTSKQLTEGWNLIGTNNNEGNAQDELSGIQNTEQDPGLLTLYVPETRNAKTDIGISWAPNVNRDINANPITQLPGDGELSAVDGYWAKLSGERTLSKQLK